MDCGPAVLKCLLEGFGISVGYGRLREACQTDVDGTSIDVLEEVAGRLGLDAEQVMLPVDLLLLPEVAALPAILVIRLPDGQTHFVLAWRRHGPFVQVMDPGVGRRWMRGKRLLEEAYVHSQRLPAQTWRAWAASDGLRRPLVRRLGRLGLGRAAVALFDEAAADLGWRSLARLEAAARFVESLVLSSSIPLSLRVRGLGTIHCHCAAGVGGGVIGCSS
jgi:ATP-binding cassette subfamily B protein